MAEVQKYRVLGGRHVDVVRKSDKLTDLNGKETNVYDKGEIVESSDDLIAKFPGKFELVVDAPATPKGKKKLLKAPVEEEPEEEDGEEAEPESEEEDGSIGEDVTGDFKKAVQADLKVFKKGKLYNVVDADEPDTVLEGGGDLDTKKHVNEFISKYLTK